MTPFERATLNLPPPRKFIENAVRNFGCSRAEAKRQLARLQRDEVYLNDEYQVNVDREPDTPQPAPGVRVIHLSIKRRDRQPARDWRHLQAIKNQLVGRDHEAVEIFPAESRLIDTANQTHLWVLVDAETGGPVPMGIGWYGGRLVSSESVGGVVQRPRE